MEKAHPVPSPEFERFRPYLQILARIHLDPRLQVRVSPSDIVQETFLEACRDLPDFRGRELGQQIAWLRSILAHNLARAAHEHHREKRDIDRERSLEEALGRSSGGLESVLADSGSSPSDKAMRKEMLIDVSRVIGELPGDQRDALLLHYLEGLSLPEIGERLGRTTVSAAGLVRRGLGRLRDLLREKGL
jgi:RNA polymerase sigma-70 factor (ECF subfamily)